MPARLPHFLGLGTQKGGTTTLHRLLSQHPQTYLPECKEVHYFDLNHSAGEAWYSRHFQGAGTMQKCGEITPFYLFHPDVPQRIQRFLPEARLIGLLRHPADRAISQLFHARKRGFEPLDPAEALQAESSRLASGNPISLQKHSYVSRSRYLEQLDRYEALFASQQLLILRSEDLFEQPAKIWLTIQRFLGIKSIELPMALPRANPGSGEASSFDPALRQQLFEQLAETIEGVSNRYGISWPLS